MRILTKNSSQMEKETRINALFKIHDKIKHRREFEIDGIVKQMPKLLEAVAYYAQKAVCVAGNRNATLNVVEDHLWSILGSLWDDRLLIPRKGSPVARTDKCDDQTSQHSELIATQNKLNTALDLIDSLRSQIDALNATLSFGTTHTPTKKSEADEIVQVSSPLVTPGRFGTLPDASGDGVDSVVGVFTMSSTERIIIDTDPEFVIEPCMGYWVIERPSESQEALVERENTASTEASSAIGRRSIKRTESSDQNIARENELRINSLLHEVIERDELINSLSEELNRIKGNAVEAIREASADDKRNSSGKIDIGDNDNVRDILTGRIREINELRQKVSDLESKNLRVLGERDLLQIQLDKMNEESSTQRVVVKRSVFASTSGLVSVEENKDESISARIASSVNKECFDSPCQTADFIVTLSCTVARHVNIPPSLDGNLLVRLEQEHESAVCAMRETEKTKMSLGQLEKQLAILQLQLKRHGVKEAHIHTAMSRSGLTRLMKANKPGVFERLYQDAFNRIVRMQRIRDELRELQSREFCKRISSETNATQKIFEFIPTRPHLIPAGNDSVIGRQYFGGGWGFPTQALCHAKHAGGGNSRPRSLSLSINEYLVTTPLVTPTSR